MPFVWTPTPPPTTASSIIYFSFLHVAIVGVLFSFIPFCIRVLLVSCFLFCFLRLSNRQRLAPLTIFFRNRLSAHNLNLLLVLFTPFVCADGGRLRTATQNIVYACSGRFEREHCHACRLGWRGALQEG